ncbi:MAG: 8-amino-7-oxononanoate synthase, partial [Myxococcota bacterium]
VHHRLEEALSIRYGRPATLLSSGYHANLALLTTVLGRGDVVASDALNHASIIDGIRLSRADKVILPHGDPAIPVGTTLAVTEGLFSMDGDIPALPAWQGSHWLMVDEAHAFGVLGPDGLGAAAAQGVSPDFIVGTFGKAIGAYGAFIVGPESLRSLLMSAGRAFIFTTGLPEPVAAASLAGLHRADDGLRQQLAANVTRLRSGLSHLGLPALGDAHIVPVVLGAATMPVAEALLSAGYYAAGIRPPTVAPGAERIRLTLSAAHTADQIDGLLDALDVAVRQARIDVSGMS